MHDRLFQNPSRLDETSLRQHAVAVGLDTAKFDTCMAEGQAGEQVSADVVAARALGVSGTPAFLLGIRLPDASVQPQKWLSGSLPFPELENELNRVLGLVQP
jgi:predicted DsbA family dithiol-disulfide isomerase